MSPTIGIFFDFRIYGSVTELYKSKGSRMSLKCLCQHHMAATVPLGGLCFEVSISCFISLYSTVGIGRILKYQIGTVPNWYTTVISEMTRGVPIWYRHAS